MNRSVFTVLISLGLVTAATADAAPPAGNTASVSATTSGASAPTPLAPSQYTALPVTVPVETAMAVQDPQFVLTVPVRLIGMPRNADIANVKCRVSLMSGGSSVADAFNSIDAPIPPAADASPTTLRQLIGNVTVPVTFPAATTAALLAGQAMYQCEIYVRHVVDPQHQELLAPIYSGGGGMRATFPLPPNVSYQVNTTGNFR